MIPRLLAIAIAAFTVGADCSGSPPTPPPESNEYCAGAVAEAEPTLLESAYDSVSSALATIIGGEVSVDRRATVQVLMPPSGYCSGTVIGPRTVLTAAHCEAHVMEILVDGQRIRASHIIPHPAYSGSYPFNDLLLLRFAQDLPGPIVNTVYEAGTEGCTQLLAQGLGKSEFNEPPTLRESMYTVVSEGAMVLHTKQASWGGICFGDSGGPLYAVVNDELQLAGVTSTTYTEDCLVGGDHVNLRFFKPWLSANVR